MKLLHQVTNRRWGVLAFSLMLVGAMVALKQVRPQFSEGPTVELARLESERSALARFDNATVQRLRATASQVQSGDAQGLGKLPPGWISESVPVDSGRTPQVRLTRSGGPPPTWTEVLQLVERIEQRTSILSLAIQSAGTRRQRTIERVEIVVRETPGATRRPADAPLPEASGPELVRKIGLGPSLRRSSAFTGWLRRPVPAPDPVSAAFRPDPPHAAGVRSNLRLFQFNPLST